MKPERWRKVEEVFQSALERDEQEREAFLDQACAGDASLRREVESLIAADEQAGSFIDAPSLAPEEEYLSGRRIGPYRVIREIGHGGMGSVYLAEREDEYRKQVAIKLVRRGMDSDFIISRFLGERQILASLDHPNIARLLDGGTTRDGLPYFVMEYIEGKPIDRYSNENRLDTAARLRLFRDVCSAVHYAHRNLVIHRDIKPGNILVTAGGSVKLLDFGIAKLLDPASQPLDQTVTAIRMMTPDYASPEQIRGLAITTASDIYSLGVVLYELLTGHKPHHFDGLTPDEIEQVICEKEPDRPGITVTRREETVASTDTLRDTFTTERVSDARAIAPEKPRRRLTGDLDNIVLMAMRKEPERRYSSAEQLSEDIRRHLVGLPVIARRDTLAYRTSKFVRRHRAGVIAAALIALALVAGLAVSLWQAGVARRERARAERRFNDVRSLANSFLFEFHDAISDLPGSTRARELVVRRAIEYLDSLAQEAGDDLSLRLEMAKAYEKVGDVQGNPFFNNLGDTAGAVESYKKALAIRESVAASDPADAQAAGDLALSYIKMGDMLSATSDTTGARLNYQKALAINESRAAADPAGIEARRNLAFNYHKLGLSLAGTGDAAGALENHRRALSIRETLASDEPANHQARRDVSVSHSSIAAALFALGDASGALESHRKALEIRLSLAAADPTNTRARGDVALTYERMGDVLAENGDTVEALDSYRKAQALRQDLTAADPKNAFAGKAFAWTCYKVGEMLSSTGDRAEAEKNYQEAMAVFEASYRVDPASAQTRGDLSFGYEGMGSILALTGKTDAALEYHRKSLALREALSSADPTDATARNVLIVSYSKIGDILIAKGEAAAAVEIYLKALSVCEHLSAAYPMNAKYRRQVADTCARLGKAHRSVAGASTERLSQARSWYQKSLDIYLDLRARGALTSVNESKPDEMAREIAGCDAALARSKAR
jgi:serine/threonine protein kinase/predicted negative regulator of RcsB-dependent stress response